MKPLLWIGALVCTSVLPSRAALITSSASCGIDGEPGITVSGLNANCFGANSQGFYASAASSNISYQVSGSTLSVSQSVNASSSTVGAGLAANSLYLVVSTPGLPRAGILRGNIFPFRLGETTASFTFTGDPGTYPTGFGPGAPPIAISLGGLFGFSSSTSVVAYDRVSEASIRGTLSFFEADGVTPVTILEVNTPEPTTVALLGLGLALLVWHRRRHLASVIGS